ncbi:hypothetical protein ABE036_17175 [Priestia aryabhattai]|uniref:Uncharacterized protein n=1 Tax=Priestia megaterium Q3 TaxID=1452722 RepID=A0A806TSP8_PRIMG|nr:MULTISPECIES: hypothetical protein [Priestia]AKP77477.1 hypothetical protein AS52_02516 [Priestia megaterium Q3]MDT0146004.1 hypothetical protein [Priestia aryabhattai]MDT0150841.1 hypothetical protein [Priestia aryabhattai]MED3959861.1 hypothetical protein [Priestia aryabhattai]MED4008137.1 hypothetical protein [Priestia aryabhattai]
MNRRQKAVGYHHESMMGGGKIVEVIDPPDSRGIYRAKVSVNGIEKIPVSTFFQRIGTELKFLMQLTKLMKINALLTVNQVYMQEGLLRV